MAVDARSGQWRRGGRARKVQEQVVKVLLTACAYVSVLTTIGIVLVLLFETIEFFRQVPIFEFLFGTRWAPNAPSNASFGVLPLITGTLVTTVIAIAVALPVGLAAAIYLSEYASRRLRRYLKPALEILAGVPTVVYGFFALTIVTPLLKSTLFSGIGTFNMLAAGLIMGVMIIPTVASVSEDAIFAVPRSLREGAYALGATKRETATRVVVPAALSGIVAAVILGISRAIGETMIVAVAAGQQANFGINPLEGALTMTSYIVQVASGETARGTTVYQTLFAVGATLFVMTLVLNLVSYWIVRRYRRSTEMAQTQQVKGPEQQGGGKFQTSVSRRHFLDRLFTGTVFVATLLGIVVLAIFLVDVAIDGIPELSWQFLTSFPSQLFPENSGIFPALIGSLWLLGLTALFSVPLGVGAAVYLEEYAPNNIFTRIIEVNITNLAGVPSIIYGILGLGIFVNLLGFATGGPSVLTGALTLALLILPVIIVATREALRSIPNAVREGGYALGATRWEVIRSHLLPMAIPGALTGTILALSRAIGETAPLIVVGASLYLTQLTTSPFERYMALPYQIFNWISQPQAEFEVLAAAGIVVIMVVLLLANSVAIYLRNKYQTGE